MIKHALGIMDASTITIHLNEAIHKKSVSIKAILKDNVMYNFTLKEVTGSACLVQEERKVDDGSVFS